MAAQSTLDDSGQSVGGAFVLHQEGSQDETLAVSGNKVSGAYSSNGSLAAQSELTLTTTAADGSGSVLSASTQTTANVGQEGSEVDGSYTSTEQGTDTFTLNQQGSNNVNGVLLAFTEVLAGGESFQLTESGVGSQVTQQTITGTGNWQRTEWGAGALLGNGAGGYGYTATTQGELRTGALTQAVVGATRYSELEQFNDASNTGAGMAPGTLAFSPVGGAFRLREGEATGDGPGPLAGGGYQGAGVGGVLDGSTLTAAAEQQAQVVEGQDLYLKSCFAAGMPILIPGGSKFIEQIAPGDFVLCRDESGPQWAVVARVVEEVFVRVGRLLNLLVGGRVIRTSAEHRFWARGRGWVEASALGAGDELSDHHGGWVAVEGVEDKGEYATLYNMRVAQHHTYFVGSAEWCFSVWAHNDYDGFRQILRAEHYDELESLYEHALAGGFTGNDYYKFLQRIKEIQPDIATDAIVDAWSYIKQERSRLARSGTPVGEALPAGMTVEQAGELNRQAANKFLQALVAQAPDFQPLVGSGDPSSPDEQLQGNGLLYCIPAEQLKARKPYVGITHLDGTADNVEQAIRRRMTRRDHKLKTLNQQAPEPNLGARSLTYLERVGLETVLVETGGEQLSNGRAEREPDHEEYVPAILAAYRLLRARFLAGEQQSNQ